MFPKIKLIQIARQYLQYYYYKYVTGTEDNVHKNFCLPFLVYFLLVYIVSAPFSHEIILFS